MSSLMQIISFMLVLIDVWLGWSVWRNGIMDDPQCGFLTTSIPIMTKRRQPKVVLLDSSGNFHVANAVFERLGFTRHGIGNSIKDITENGPIIHDWDVCWTRHWPFTTKNKALWKNVLRDQKFNHIPGMGLITDKVTLTTFEPTRHTPLTFVMPKQKQEFLKKIKESPNSAQRWIQKGIQHRGNIVKPIRDLDLDKEGVIQEFISNQLLIHGHVAQFVAFVVVTSITPLRAYIYSTDPSGRIAPNKYEPDDFGNIDTYVTDGDHSKLLIDQASPNDVIRISL
ncbi:probable tubulin polyglutamylase ttll-15 [Amphiura filiformis]|uniref:probable tubulin polyglutamylase ttll-15 n=1 Tax=Amphiura filiformis TaxID=82378 RepID=UPI003B21E27A